MEDGSGGARLSVPGLSRSYGIKSVLNVSLSSLVPSFSKNEVNEQVKQSSKIFIEWALSTFVSSWRIFRGRIRCSYPHPRLLGQYQKLTFQHHF